MIEPIQWWLINQNLTCTRPATRCHVIIIIIISVFYIALYTPHLKALPILLPWSLGHFIPSIISAPWGVYSLCRQTLGLSNYNSDNPNITGACPLQDALSKKSCMNEYKGRDVMGCWKGKKLNYERECFWVRRLLTYIYLWFRQTYSKIWGDPYGFIFIFLWIWSYLIRCLVCTEIKY